MFANYYDNKYELNELALSAIAGEGLYGQANWEMGRAEVVEKMSQDGAAVLYMLHEMHQAVLQSQDIDANEEEGKSAELIEGGQHSWVCSLHFATTTITSTILPTPLDSSSSRVLFAVRVPHTLLSRPLASLLLLLLLLRTGRGLRSVRWR